MRVFHSTSNVIVIDYRLLIVRVFNGSISCMYICVLGIKMGLSAPMADRPYSGFSYSSERTTKHMIRGADIGASIDTVIMPYTRQRGYPCENRN